MVSPIVLISGASGRSFGTGRIATNTESTPSAAQATIAPSERAIDVGAGVDHQEQADEGADHEDFAVREIQQVEHAEDQRVADRHQRVGRAEHQAVDQLLIDHAGRERCATPDIIGIAIWRRNGARRRPDRMPSQPIQSLR